MIIKTRGICLHTTKYAESSLIAQVFTEEKGLQSYIISGVRQRKPRVHASLLQPMSMLDIVAYYKPTQQLFRTKELKAHYVYQRIPFELPRSSVALFVAEVTLKALRESDAPDGLFEYLIAFLHVLDETGLGLGNLPCFYLVSLVKYLGFEPELPDYGGPYFFDKLQGYFVPEPPEHEAYADDDVSRFLLMLLSSNLSDIQQVIVDKGLRSRTVEVLLSYMQTHLEGFKKVTSHRVLASVLR